MSSDHIQLYSKWYTYFSSELGGAAFGTSLFISVLSKRVWYPYLGTKVNMIGYMPFYTNNECITSMF